MKAVLYLSALYHVGIHWPFAKDGCSSLKRELFLLFSLSYILHFARSDFCSGGGRGITDSLTMDNLICPGIWLSSAPSDPSTCICLHCYKADKLEMKSEEMMCP